MSNTHEKHFTVRDQTAVLGQVNYLVNLSLRMIGQPRYLSDGYYDRAGNPIEYRAQTPAEIAPSLSVSVSRSTSRFPIVGMGVKAPTSYVWPEVAQPRPVNRSWHYTFEGSPVRRFPYKLSWLKEMYLFENAGGEDEPIPVRHEQGSLKESLRHMFKDRVLTVAEEPDYGVFGLSECAALLEDVQLLGIPLPSVQDAVPRETR